MADFGIQTSVYLHHNHPDQERMLPCGSLQLWNLFDAKGKFKAYFDLRRGGLPPKEKIGFWKWNKSHYQGDAYWDASQRGWLAADIRYDGNICLYDSATNMLVCVLADVLNIPANSPYVLNGKDFTATRITTGSDGKKTNQEMTVSMLVYKSAA
jgi:hypothetical protein